MDALVSWILLVLVQKEGFLGQGFGTEAACQEVRQEVLKRAEVLAVSACTPIKLESNEAK